MSIKFIDLTEDQPTFAELAAQLRVFRGENVRLMRSTLYYNLPMILEALDIAAAQGVTAGYKVERGLLSSPLEIKSP